MSGFVTVIVAVVSGLFGYFSQSLKSHQDNEGIYAKYSGDLIKRVEDLTDERDDLKEQVLILQGQVTELSRQVKELRKDLKKDGDLTTTK